LTASEPARRAAATLRSRDHNKPVQQVGEGEETPEGHVVRYAPDTNRVVGLTVLGTKRVLERDGHLAVTVPETIKTTAEENGPRGGTRWDMIIDRRLAEGALPFANSDICPVSSYGVMEPFRFGNPPELVEFAETHLGDYEELDELGAVVSEWAHRIALDARQIVGA
jgi:hypothetical protein